MRYEAHGSFQFTRQSKFFKKEINSRLKWKNVFSLPQHLKFGKAFSRAKSGRMTSNSSW
jgi:hypothetical protein